jgi:fatty-acyl-CoA synthase
MFGLMQDHPLLVSDIIRHAARHHGSTEIVSRRADGSLARTTYTALEARARRLARALQFLGVAQGDPVATLAWNSDRHLELYYAAAGMGAIYHTVNPRLAPDDIAYIFDHAGSRWLFAEAMFAPAIAEALARCTNGLRGVVLLCAPAEMPGDIALPAGTALLCYEALLAAADEDFDWPALDERTACGLCYTSGTTGRPKGVLYSHRSNVLHALAINGGGAFALRPGDRVMPVVPMFHANAWGLPFGAPAAGAALVMPGRHLDGASLAALMNAEQVTISAGVPSVWLNLLAHLRASGERLASVRRLVIGGSACPPSLVAAFADEYGVAVEHAWGMTESSPIGTLNRAGAMPGEDEAVARERQRKQGRAPFLFDLRIVDAHGTELPWDSEAFGNLQVRGPWVCSAYKGDPPGSALDAEGWFTTGDVATMTPDGLMEITDRSKDVIKSGGEWISSILLENIAAGHPDVAEAAVIAAEHPQWTERPLLLVVAKAGRTPSVESLLAAYTGKVPRYYVPDTAIIVSELPHGATGKLNKLALRAQYRRYLLARPA